MATFTVQEIVRATQGALVVGDLGVPVTGVSIDSRTLGVGEAFFAIVGHRLDGHDFIADAASRGAACVVAQNVPDHIPAGSPPDTGRSSRFPWPPSPDRTARPRPRK